MGFIEDPVDMRDQGGVTRLAEVRRKSSDWWNRKLGRRSKRRGKNTKSCDIKEYEIFLMLGNGK